MRGLRISLSLFVMAALLGAAARPGQAQAEPPAPQLRLHRGVWDAATAGPTLSAAALQPWAAAAPGPYAIIQLRGPVTLADRAALEAVGLTLVEYLPDFAFLVRGDPGALAAATALPRVYAHTPFTLADKLAPGLWRTLARGAAPAGPVRLLAWPGEEAALARELAARGVSAPTATAPTAAQLAQWAGLASVRWIEPAPRWQTFNDVALTIMGAAPARPTLGLYGAGQIVAVTDSGLDTGALGTLSTDFAGRIVATQVLSATGDWADQSGHGTHVAGSVAGAGVLSGAITATRQYTGTFAGLAPEAQLVIQAFESDANTGAITGLPDNLYPLYAQARANGARVHTNSWGGTTGDESDPEAVWGGYPSFSERTDAFLWDNPDSIILFAAGNSGIDGTPNGLLCDGSDGVVDPDSMATPATAKNVITVGASESTRTSGGVGSYPWFLLNLCFLGAPFGSDPMADNADGMAAFSSRGPVDDGRVKPDLVAPGTNIVSARSHAPGAGTLFGVHETNPNYLYAAGTSMATPLTAGLATLTRQWLGVTHGLSNPSAAALKAVLLNTTQDMGAGQYGTGATREIPAARPNSVNGWGRASAGFMTAPEPFGLWVVDRTAGLTTGQVLTYTHTPTQSLQVVTSTQPLRVMLVWTDPPASLSAATQLVNDLDLTVFGPTGLVYRGNGGGSADRLNNVEGVIIPNPAVGVYTATVSAYNVPLGPQPFALVTAGPLIGDVAEPPPPPVQYRNYLPVMLR